LRLGGLAVPLRRLLAEGYRFRTLVAYFRHHDSQLFFKPLGHQPPMTPHVKRLPAEQNGVGAEVLGNLLYVQRIELLAVFPVEQFRVSRFQKPAGRSKGGCTAFPDRTWALPG